MEGGEEEEEGTNHMEQKGGRRHGTSEPGEQGKQWEAGWPLRPRALGRAGAAPEGPVGAGGLGRASARPCCPLSLPAGCTFSPSPPHSPVHCPLFPSPPSPGELIFFSLLLASFQLLFQDRKKNNN